MILCSHKRVTTDVNENYSRFRRYDDQRYMKKEFQPIVTKITVVIRYNIYLFSNNNLL